MKISEKWKRPVRLAFATAIVFFMMAVLFLFNEYHFRIGFEFKFQSDPRTAKPPANPALEALYLEDPIARHRDSTT